MSKIATITEIHNISKKSRQILYDNESLVISKLVSGEIMVSNEIQSDFSSEAQPRGSESAANESSSLSASFGEISQPLRNALRIIAAQFEHVPPFLFRSEAAALAGITGAASVLQAEKKAMDQGLILKHSLPRAKTGVCYWEITDKGYAVINRPVPTWSSKGGFKHKFSVHRIAITYKHHDYQTKIEYQHSNGKLIDLRTEKENNVSYVEVCASWPVQKEMTNVKLDLERAPLPDELILAVTDRKMKQPLISLLNEVVERERISCPVRVELAGDLIEFLDVKK